MRQPWDRLYAIAQPIERWLTRAVVLGIVALVAVQVLMTGDVVRSHLSLLERLEGRRIDVPPRAATEPGAAPAVAGTVRRTLRVAVHLLNREAAPRAAVRVNGTAVAYFTRPRVEVRVAPGDLVEVDGSAVPGELRFRVTHVDAAVLRPELGQEVTTRGDLAPLGRVRVDG